ncbi:uncharacterized protein LOC135389393 [Ornithodoros turicata]|uniref:uncharacterized protein LOC135389393 n=1 Tax=Ornithodoros turicata TaxID=34597 RepID=UPI00313A454E
MSPSGRARKLWAVRVVWRGCLPRAEGMLPLGKRHVEESSPARNSSKRTRKTGTRYCCVVGCHNSEENVKGRVPAISFYRFPGRPWETERRKAWIAAVRRKNADGSDWTPNSSSRICGAHFVGNCKSDIQMDPSYVPTIFPPVYRKRAPDGERHKRWQRRSQAGAVSSPSTPECMPVTDNDENASNTMTADDSEDVADSDIADSGLHVLAEAAGDAEPAKVKVVDQGTQTECDSNHGQLQLFLSTTDGRTGCTQVTHPTQLNKVSSGKVLTRECKYPSP